MRCRACPHRSQAKDCFVDQQEPSGCSTVDLSEFVARSHGACGSSRAQRHSRVSASIMPVWGSWAYNRRPPVRRPRFWRKSISVNVKEEDASHKTNGRLS